MTLTIDDAPPPGGGAELDPGMAGDPYTAKLTATGGSGGYQWALIDLGAMPAGLSLNPATGEVSGIPLPAAEGTASVLVRVTDSSGATATRRFVLTVNPGLRIVPDVELVGPDRIRLRAAGGAPAGGEHPYTWQVAGGIGLPAGLELNKDDGTITMSGTAGPRGAVRVTVRAMDSAHHVDDISLSLRIRRGIMRRRHLDPEILGLRIAVPAAVRWVRSTTFWLAVIALWVPLGGQVPVLIYTFANPGPHAKYLGVGLLTALAAMVTGWLIGFLFGVPKPSSQSQQAAAAYQPNPGLP